MAFGNIGYIFCFMFSKQFTSFLELIHAFPDQQSCIEYLEELKWKSGVVSPFDKTSKVYKCKRGYRCKNTGKNFNVMTRTIFENTKLPLQKWFMAIWLLTNHKKGITSPALACDIGVSQPTAWFLMHRIRKCFEIYNKGKLEGEVEVDETYVGGKNKNRAFHKKSKNAGGRNYTDKVPVFGMLERGGWLIAMVVKHTGAKQLQPIIRNFVKYGSTIYSDEWKAYHGIKDHCHHEIVNHSKKQYVVGDAHTNTIEGFWSQFKRSIIGNYHWISKKHLQPYLNQSVFLYNFRKALPVERFNVILLNNERLKYKDLTAP